MAGVKVDASAKVNGATNGAGMDIGTEPAKEPEKKKVKKLAKEIKGTVVTFTEAITGTVKNYDFATLPQKIKDAFGPFGLSSKLGDAAAGKSGKDVIDAIDKVWKGLSEGDWTVRAPAAPKLDKKGLTEKLDALPDKEKNAAKDLLAKLGITL